MMEKIKVNRLPGQTWNRLGMNHIELDCVPYEKGLEGEILEGQDIIAEQPLEGTVLSEVRESALGEEFVDLLKASGKARVLSLVARSGENKTCRIGFSEEEGASCGQFEIHALSRSELTLYQYFDNKEGDSVGIRSVIRAEESARVKLVQIFLPGQCKVTMNDIGARLEDNAYLEVDQIFLGGRKIVSGTEVSLQGRKASFVSNIAYDMGQGENLDLNIISRHLGKKTQAQIDVKGVLRQGAKKLLRATVDFISGCSGSVGKENEEVLLMNDSVVNQTIPLILCSEEDVEGAHGASIGRIDEEQMFYLKSRGIPEDQIAEILAQARIETVLGRIGDEETSARVKKILDEGIR